MQSAYRVIKSYVQGKCFNGRLVGMGLESGNHVLQVIQSVKLLLMGWFMIIL